MKNLFGKLQEFFLKKALGRALVRVSASLASALAGGVLGAPLDIDPVQLAAVLSAGVNALISLMKPRSNVEAEKAQP